MVPWFQRRLCSLDVETTGTDIEEARIVSIAVVLCGGGEPTKVVDLVVNPGVEIPEEASAIHGITTERARAEGVPTGEALDLVLPLIFEQVQSGGALVAFNGRFDWSITDREVRRHGVGGITLDGCVFDPLVVDRHLERFRKGSRNLAAQCERWRVQFEESHQAAADAFAAARLAWRLATSGEVVRRVRGPEDGRELARLRREWEEIRGDLPALHAAQVRWAAEQAEGLERHFAQKGQPERVERAWPIVPMPVLAG